MRRIPRLVVCAALLTGAVALSAPAQAQELPPGFTDGSPVGEDLAGSPGVEPTGQAVAAAATTRYFGRDAYAALRATVASTARPCFISDDGLTALVLAPVFKESSAATSPSTAPSPMTLSRYDEWNGVYATSGTPSNNYGLYAFRNPYTAYKNAFWHPGIGIWQYDTAGLGAPLTTVEAMDVGIVAGKVAEVVARNYCRASGTVLDRRYAAWRDWGYPCTLCEGFFQEMMGVSPRFANLSLVPGIGALGGTVPRVCSVGLTSPVPCWYVEPRVGVIQGATAWATLDPTGGSSPTVVPTPLSRPFYVVDRGATEERHWLSADTGYSIDITASRVIGRDARPRSSQPGSGLTWTSSSALCDITTGRGRCGPIPPAGVSAATLSVTGSAYRPVSLDANGDGQGDILWYNPGPGADALWLGNGAGRFTPTSVSIGGTYEHVRVGDVDGDGDDDVLFSSSGQATAYLWRSDGDGTFSSMTLSPGPGVVPILLDVDGDDADEIFWYGAGSRADSLWNWVGAGFQRSARTVGGNYQPIVGDFDGNGRDDILWYAPGAASDHLWLHKVSGGYTSTPRRINGTYQWRVGDMDGDGIDDVLWYAPGPPGDSLWFGAPRGAFGNRPLTVNGSYVPIVTDLFGTGRSIIIWYAPGPTADYLWSFSAGRVPSSSLMLLPGPQQPLLGRFSAGGAPGIVWYGPGGVLDAVWYR